MNTKDNKNKDDVLYKTYDGEVFPEEGVRALKSVLAQCPPGWLDKEDEELIDRLTRNFIGFNTREDIDRYLLHAASVSLTKMTIRRTK